MNLGYGYGLIWNLIWKLSYGLTQTIVGLILLLKKNTEGRSNESSGTGSSPFELKLAEKPQCG